MLKQIVFSKTNTLSFGGTLSAQNDEAYAGAEMIQQARASVTIPGFVVFPGEPCLVPHTIQPLTLRDFCAVSCATRDSLLLILVLVVTILANPRCWNT